MLRVIYDKRTQQLIDALEENLDEYTRLLVDHLNGQHLLHWQRAEKFEQDSHRKELNNELLRIKSIAMPLGYEIIKPAMDASEHPAV